MPRYRVQIRLELYDDDAGKLVNYDNQDHSYECPVALRHEQFEDIADSVSVTIAELEKASSQSRGTTE